MVDENENQGLVEFTIDEYRKQDGDGKRRYRAWREEQKKQDLINYKLQRSLRAQKIKMTPEEKREYNKLKSKAYYELHKKEISERYHTDVEFREKKKKAQREYYLKNRDKIRAYQNAYGKKRTRIMRGEQEWLASQNGMKQ